jgi:hypothetical protein
MKKAYENKKLSILIKSNILKIRVWLNMNYLIWNNGEREMNQFQGKAAVKARRARYPKGARVELVSMNNHYREMQSGLQGTVGFVDDTGTVFVKWDDGSAFGAVYGEDEIRLLTKAELIKWQCRQVAKTGRTNMFDSKAAFEIALKMGFDELADFIFMNTSAYSNLIFTGKLSDGDLTEWP